MEGVQPMTSAVHATLPMREDVVADGGDAARVLSNAPSPPTASSSCPRWWNSRGRPERTDPQGRLSTGWRPATFSAEELARAQVAAIEAANPSLNAYIVATPDKAIEMAKAADARRARGEAGRLEGAAIGVKDLSPPTACGTTAGSNILRRLRPAL